MIEYTNEKFLEFRDYIKKSRSFAVQPCLLFLRRARLYLTHARKHAVRLRSRVAHRPHARHQLVTRSALVVRRDEHRPARLFQVFGFLYFQRQFSLFLRHSPAPSGSAHRHQLLYLSDAQLYHRRLSRRS